ncbi:MAG: hypothetical protein ABEJ66_01815 [Candidatus Nanohaloarchaea archaeon]
MTDDTDYSEIVDKTVEDAKDAIRELENPDYEALLNAEANGENRKTLRNWLEERLEEEEREEGKEEAKNEMFLSSLAPSTALVGGVVVGLVVGLAAGAFAPVGGGPQASPGQVQQKMSELFQAAGATPDSIDVSKDHGMFFVNITTSRGNRTATQQFYVSPDAQLLFRTRGPLGRSMVQNIDSLMVRLQQQARNRTQAGNATQ